MDSKEIAKIAHQCNIKKDGAKNAQDASIELYLAEYLLRQNQLYGPIYCDATIVAVLDAAYDIFIPEYGIEKRLHLDRMALKKSTYDAGNHTLTLTWNPDAIEMNEVTESKSNTLSFDDDDTCDDDDLVQAIENQLSMKQGKVTSETTSNSSASNDILTEDTTVHLSNATSEKSNGYMSSQHYSDSPAAPNDTQIIKVFEKVKVRLEVDANKSPPMINVHSVNPHVLV
jgi:protein SSD1